MPYIKGVTSALSVISPNSIYVPGAENFDPATLPTDKPISECLEFSVEAALGGATAVKHSVVSDETGLGLFGDPAQNKVHFLNVAVVVTDATTAGKFMSFRKLKGAYGRSQLAIGTEMAVDTSGNTTFQGLCNPGIPAGDLGTGGSNPPCPILSFGVWSIDHMGLGLLVNPADPATGYWLAHIIP